MAESKTDEPKPIPTYVVPKPPEEGKDELGREVRDVFDHNNPNGIRQADISAKFPKAGGETEQKVVGEGNDQRILEVTVGQDPALATAAGGPEGAEDGTAPGPKPDPNATTGNQSAGATAAATGNTTNGKPDPAKEAELAKGTTQAKK